MKHALLCLALVAHSFDQEQVSSVGSVKEMAFFVTNQLNTLDLLWKDMSSTLLISALEVSFLCLQQQI